MDPMENKVINSNEIIHVMDERNADRSANNGNMIDKGYDLACKHLKKEIDELKPADVTSNDKLMEMYAEIAAKRFVEIADAVEVLNIVSKYTGLPKVVDSNIEDHSQYYQERLCQTKITTQTESTETEDDLPFDTDSEAVKLIRAGLEKETERYSSIFEGDVEKVYSVKFMEYTNVMEDTVAHNTLDMTYIHIDKKPFLIRETELSYYSNFGGGYESIDFVGMITKATRGGSI